MDLYQYFLQHTGRNILKYIHYFPIYERHFSRFTGHAVTMFEIGTGEGGSCQMWKGYFGPMAKIVTIDIANKKEFEESQVFVRTGSQADPEFLGELIAEFGLPDIVLDDGSHMMEHVNGSFDVLFPRMSPKGVYLVEDLDTAYWPTHGGGVHAPGSFVERCKSLVDELNADFSQGAISKSIFGQHLLSISFYQMVIAIEKAPYLNRTMTRSPIPLKISP
jgi:cephalosporin hydroxylase